MTIREITQENARDYSPAIPLEYLLEVGREYSRGLAEEDDDTGELKAAILWELRNVEDETLPTESEIVWFFASDAQCGKELLEAYDFNIGKSAVKKTYFEMPELSSLEKSVMEDEGYTLMKAESQFIYLTIEELTNARIPGKSSNSVKPIAELSSRQYKAGIMNCIYHKRYGLLDDLPFVPKSRFNPDISCCVLSDDSVAGFLLVHQLGSGVLRPELFFAVEPDSSLHLLEMLRFSIRAAADNYGPDEQVQIKRANEAIKKISAKLFPGKRGEQVVRGEKIRY